MIRMPSMWAFPVGVAGRSPAVGAGGGRPSVRAGFARGRLPRLPWLLVALLLPAPTAAWTLNERCELEWKSKEGIVAVVPSEGGVALYLPEGLAENGSRVKVTIGSRSWRVPVVAGSVELEGGEKPFLEQRWLSVHGAGDRLLRVSLTGTSAAWERLAGCRPPAAAGWVRLAGEIGSRSDDAIIGAIRRQRPEGLLLDSQGGAAEQAQRIGQVVRDAGIKTRVASGASCLSECVFVLAAGASRQVEAGGRVGLRPSLFTSGLGVYQGDPPPYADSAVYFSRMGVNGGKLAVLATAVKGDELHLLSADELREAGLVDAKLGGASAPAALGRLSQPAQSGWWWWASLLGLALVLSWVTGRWREG